MSEEIPPLKTIMVPLDGSDFSFRAANYAIKIAQMSSSSAATGGGDDDTKIICVHVVVNLPYNAYVTTGAMINQYIDDMNKQAQQWYDKVSALAEKAKVKVSSQTIVDVVSVTGAIINFAEKNGVDLIIMGTKGRTGIKKFVLGSVASGVISHAHCPVLVVR